MLRALLRGTELRQILDFVSPAFFDVVPTRDAVALVRELLASRMDTDRFQKALEEASRGLESTTLPLRLSSEVANTEQWWRTDAAPQSGERLLLFYFHQLLRPGPFFLDLRPGSLRDDEGALEIAPSALFTALSDEFREAMVAIYTGFYAGDDDAFRAGLGRLGLESAEPLFREHFGGEDQRAVAFAMKTFVASFHQIFLHCQRHAVTLHADFIPFGASLTTLYAALEPLATPLDVRSAWDRALAASV